MKSVNSFYTVVSIYGFLTRCYNNILISLLNSTLLSFISLSSSTLAPTTDEKRSQGGSRAAPGKDECDQQQWAPHWRQWWPPQMALTRCPLFRRHLSICWTIHCFQSWNLGPSIIRKLGGGKRMGPREPDPLQLALVLTCGHEYISWPTPEDPCPGPRLRRGSSDFSNGNHHRPGTLACWLPAKCPDTISLARWLRPYMHGNPWWTWWGPCIKHIRRKAEHSKHTKHGFFVDPIKGRYCFKMKNSFFLPFFFLSC